MKRNMETIVLSSFKMHFYKKGETLKDVNLFCKLYFLNDDHFKINNKPKNMSTNQFPAVATVTQIPFFL